MERPRVFSIDPYIEGGANFGAQIVVNPEAASRVLKAADFKKDIYVTRRQHERYREVDGQGEAIALKLFAIPKSIKSTRFHDLAMIPDSFIIGIDDEALTERADVRTKKRYKKHQEKNGQDILREEFLGGFNTEVAKALKTALRREKLGWVENRSGYEKYIGG